MLRWLVVAVVAAGLAGCSGGEGDPDPPASPTASDSASDGASDGASPTPTVEPTESDETEPLALATHIARGRLQLDAGTARKLVAGRLVTWRALDGTPDPLRVLRRDRLPRQVHLDTVVVVPASAVQPTVAVATVAGIDPLRRPAAYPLQVPGVAPAEPTVLRVLGDIMLGRGVAAASSESDPVAALRPLARHLAGADLTVGNLESTLSTAGPPQQGGDSFVVTPEALPGLAELGIDAVSLANNHTGDFGDRALRETVRAFRGAELAAFGAGTDVAAASQPWVAEVDGVSFAFVGFNAIGETPRATPTSAGALSVRMPPRTGPLDRGDLRHLERVVRRLDRQVDVVTVLPHWGTQYTHVAEPVQSLVAGRLVAAGADLVVGGHPHWVQGLEPAGDAVVAHSLGNLVFDMDFMEQTMEGVTLTATFWGDELKQVELTPYRLDDRFRPRLVTGSAAQDILDDVWAHSSGPYAAR
jgi:poly-gamma-glutamate synthesis protein (capsule biosynthesis protein)